MRGWNEGQGEMSIARQGKNIARQERYRAIMEDHATVGQ
jgi:hypothetical protein